MLLVPKVILEDNKIELRVQRNLNVLTGALTDKNSNCWQKLVTLAFWNPTARSLH